MPHLILDTSKRVLHANAITASWTSIRATTAGYAARNCAVNLLFGSWARLMALVGRKILSLCTEYLHEHAELGERGRGREGGRDCHEPHASADRAGDGVDL